MAVFEINELPGRESRIDCAFFLGSSTGTFEDDREVVRDVVRAGRVREERTGRRRAAPAASVSYGSKVQLLEYIASQFNYIPTALLAKRDAIVR